MFVERLESLLKDKKILKGELLKECNLAENSFSNWRNRGTIPNGKTLNKIAEFLDVSTDYLLGIDETQKKNFKEDDFVSALENALVEKGYKIRIEAKPDKKYNYRIEADDGSFIVLDIMKNLSPAKQEQLLEFAKYLADKEEKDK